MKSIDVIKRPLITEKGTWGMNEQNRYAFVVNPRATKVDIKRAVEELYNVKVERVNTQTRKGEHRRFKYGIRRESTTKLATVRLAEGSTIELF